MLCTGQPLVSREQIQPNSLRIVLRNTAPLFVCHREGMLCLREPLVGSEAEPPDGLGVVLRHAKAAGIQHPEVVLRGGVSLLGGETEPTGRLGVVLWDTLTPPKQRREAELRFGIPLTSRTPKGFYILRVRLSLSTLVGGRLWIGFDRMEHSEADEKHTDDGRGDDPASHGWHVTCLPVSSQRKG